MFIRQETSSDTPAVRLLNKAAFGQDGEADLVDALRASGDAVLSLVMEDERRIIGHILFSKLQQPDKCLALAPIAVLPECQNQGVGSQLIRESLDRISKDDWDGVFVLGDPAYYQRFGFSLELADRFETNYPQEYFMALETTPGALTAMKGAVVYALPFLALG